jgi:hypothetical protein
LISSAFICITWLVTGTDDVVPICLSVRYEGQEHGTGAKMTLELSRSATSRACLFFTALFTVEAD